jgi:hypothetical protein
MASGSQQPELEGWERFVGTWTTEASHPLLPGAAIRGESTFEWLRGRRFLIQRSRYDDPRIPDAVAIIGVTDGELAMHYFDERGVHRVYGASLSGDTWRFWRDTPGFSQRFAGTFGQDGTTITGRGELSRDGARWDDDLAIAYRKLA